MRAIRKLYSFNALLLLAGTASAQTDIGGNVFDGMGGPLLSGQTYHVTSVLTIPAGQTLTVQPGVIIKVQNSTISIDVSGKLDVQGSSLAPVFVTSILDDTVGGDSAGDGPTVGFRGDWEGIRFLVGSTGSVIDNAVIRFGGRTSVSGIEIWNATDLVVRNTIVEDSLDHGMDVRMSSTELTVTNCNFRNNGRRSVDHLIIWQLEGFSNNIASGNRIADNTLVQNSAVDRDVVIGPDNLIDDVLYLTDTCTIPAGLSLTLLPGTIVKFDDIGVGMDVTGSLVAKGTAADRIIFTAIRDDDFGGDSELDGPTNGTAGEWQGLNLLNAEASVIEYALVRYTGRSGFAGVASGSNAVSLTAVRSEHSSDHGFELFGLGGTGNNLVAFACDGDGLRLAGGSFDLRHATATSCGNIGIERSGSYGGSIVNSISWGNTQQNYGGLTPGSLLFSNGDPGSAGSNGNIFADPLFTDPSAGVGNLALQAGSPCTDSADVTTATAVVMDHIDNSRLLDSDLTAQLLPDMGAYERARWTFSVTGSPRAGGSLSCLIQGPPGTSQYLMGRLDGVSLVDPFGFITAGTNSLINLQQVSVGTSTLINIPSLVELVGVRVGIQTQTFDASFPSLGNITQLYSVELGAVTHLTPQSRP